MRVNVKVSGRNVRGEYCYHGDTLDMESFLRRAAFIKQAAHELGGEGRDDPRGSGQAVDRAGRPAAGAACRKTLRSPRKKPSDDAEEQAAAMELLRDPRLLERVLADFDKCGVVGEETNKRVSYLAAVSRLLEKPLAIVVQSSSSAGKSSLMEAVLDFMPEEQREELHGDDRAGALLHGAEKSQAQNPRDRRKKKEPKRASLSAETVASRKACSKIASPAKTR